MIRPRAMVQRGLVLDDRYRLDRVMAVGGMGEIWSATDTVLERRVAVKVLRADIADVAGFLERFRTEARHLAMLSHPAIATLFDYGEQLGVPYLVMELVAGEDLVAHRARQSPMSVPHVVDIVTQIAAGLGAAHEAGIVHRDIKPANIMITERGRVKITDFGISRLVDSPRHTLTNDVIGTPQYMSPEHIGGGDVTPASDVYSLGVVAYELLTGHPPFVGDTPIATAVAQLHDLPAPLPSTVPEPLRTVIERALCKAPTDRPADGQAVVDELNVSNPALPFTVPSGQLARTVVMPEGVASAPTAALSPATQVDTVMQPHRPVAQPLIEPLTRHRTKRRASIALVVVASAALATAAALGGGPKGPSLATADPTTVPAQSPSPSPSPSQSSVAPTTEAVTSIAGPALIAVDPASYVGRDRRQVVDELRALGFIVNEVPVAADRGAKKNSVVGVTPTGSLEPGTTIEVQIAESGKGKNTSGG